MLCALHYTTHTNQKDSVTNYTQQLGNKVVPSMVQNTGATQKAHKDPFKLLQWARAGHRND